MRTSTSTIDPEALLRENEAADFLGLSSRTLQAWRCRGTGPAYCAAGRAIRYRRKDLINWIEANLVAPVKHGDATSKDDR